MADMPIWKLSPINLDDPNWEASIFKSEVIVRADKEEAARRRCSMAFGIATVRKPREKVKVIPWGQPDLVRCARLANSEYSEEGPEAILVPEEAERNIP